MAPLSRVVEDVCKSLKPVRDPSKCQLLANNKEQELTTPLRYANFSKDAKLELRTGPLHPLVNEVVTSNFCYYLGYSPLFIFGLSLDCRALIEEQSHVLCIGNMLLGFES